MQKLYPVAKPETRQYFVDPSHFNPSPIEEEGYESGEKTSYLKPGKIPNLMELCKPEGKKFTITEEPDLETLAIKTMIVGIRGILPNEPVGSRYHLVAFENLDFKLTHSVPGQSDLEGVIVLRVTGKETTITGLPISWMFNVGDVIAVPIKVSYSRGSRCFEFTGEGTYDNGRAVVYGFKLNLDWKDSAIIHQ